MWKLFTDHPPCQHVAKRTVRAVYVVQRLTDGKWKNEHASNGMPLWATTELKAEQLIRDLDGTRTYRITKIQD